jgi:hypothetical protein
LTNARLCTSDGPQEYDFLVTKPELATATVTQNLLLGGMSLEQAATFRGLPVKSVEIHALEGLRR